MTAFSVLWRCLYFGRPRGGLVSCNLFILSNLHRIHGIRHVSRTCWRITVRRGDSWKNRVFRVKNRDSVEKMLPTVRML